jgi:hypothetical protein
MVIFIIKRWDFYKYTYLLKVHYHCRLYQVVSRRNGVSLKYQDNNVFYLIPVILRIKKTNLPTIKTRF